jgi:hypothetical protein
MQAMAMASIVSGNGRRVMTLEVLGWMGIASAAQRRVCMDFTSSGLHG